MQKERDTAFRPTVLMNAEEYQISWDENKEEDWLLSLPNEAESTYKIFEDGSIEGTFKFPMVVFPENGLESFTVENIGVGVPKS